MKVSTEQLRLALQDCGRVMRGKTLNEITQNVFLSDATGELIIESTNYDAFVERRIECEAGAMTFLVNYRKLHEVIANTTAPTVSIAVASAGKIAIQGEGTAGVVTLGVLPPENWPAAPTQGFKGVGVPVDELANGIEVAAACADESDDRTESVIISSQPTRLLVAGCERGHFWGIYSKALVCEERKLLIHRKLAVWLPDDLRREGAVFQANDKMVRVVHDLGSLSVKLSERPVIGFEKYFDARKGMKGTYLDREVMLRACRYAMAFTPSDKSPTLYVQRDGDKVKFQSRASTDGSADEIEAPGQPMKFAVNARYLTEALSKTKADEVLIIDAHETEIRAIFVEHGDLLYIIGLLNWDL